MRPAILFDIDGTLMRCGGAGRAAMEIALQSFGRPPDALPPNFAGRTDRGIAQHAFGAELDDDLFSRFEAAYLAALPDALAASPGLGVLDGVIARLLELERRAHLGLCTGNTAAGAEAKLRHVGLWEHFRFGGYGCDAAERALVVRHALARAAAFADCPLHDLPVVVVGDTPKDVAAAHAAGVPCVAVATGPYSFDFLAAVGADAVIASLDHPGATEMICAVARPVIDH